MLTAYENKILRYGKDRCRPGFGVLGMACLSLAL